MGYHLNRLDEPVFMAVSKPLLTEVGIHHRLESCDTVKFEFMVVRADTFLDLKALVDFFSESYQRLPQERPPDVPLLPEDVPTEVQSAAAHPERSRERRNR